jgi:hypothetical protein
MEWYHVSFLPSKLWIYPPFFLRGGCLQGPCLKLGLAAWDVYPPVHELLVKSEGGKSRKAMELGKNNGSKYNSGDRIQKVPLINIFQPPQSDNMH